MTVQWLTGDVLDHVRSLPDNSVDLVATSPPFWKLRDYGDGPLPGQWGQEPSAAAFLDHLLELAVELRRVLAPHGSIAIELGDTFANSGGAGGDYNDGGMRDGQPKWNGSARTSTGHTKRLNGPGLPPAKSLCGTPTLFAWSLAYGRNLLGGIELEPWRVRNVIVWARNNPPVGALADKVRPATSYITVACPSGKRWFDLDAVRTPLTEPGRIQRRLKGSSRSDGWGRPEDGIEQNSAGAPPLDHWHDEYDGDLTWLINTQGSSLAHYAMWPASLAERLILSMCPAHVCRECGEPRRRLVESERHQPTNRLERSMVARQQGDKHGLTELSAFPGDGATTYRTIGWSDCGHDDYRPGHALDPFCGTGTTLAVADIHGRDATGIDLDPGAQCLYERRYEECWKALKPGPSPVTAHGTQLDLLAEASG